MVLIWHLMSANDLTMSLSLLVCEKGGANNFKGGRFTSK